MLTQVLSPPTIQSALGIHTGDNIATSYSTSPYVVHHIHGPFTYFTGVGHLVILDHPEVSVTLSTPNAKRKGTAGFINNIRQVNDRWYTAQNDEVFITKTALATLPPTTFFDIFDPPGQVELLPIPLRYKLHPSVDYDAGPRRTWHCDDCNVDFNAVPTNRYWCRHNCTDEPIAREIFYVRAPKPDDRRRYISYYIMTLNSYRYAPLPTAITRTTVASELLVLT
jgi:hypothetical protein